MVGTELIGHVKNMAKLPSFSFTFSGGNWDEKYHTVGRLEGGGGG